MKAIVNTIATHIIIGIAAFSLQPLAAEAYWRTSSSSVPATAAAVARLCGVALSLNATDANFKLVYCS